MLNDKIYAIGGTTNDEYAIQSVVEEYNPKTDRWVRKSKMPIPRSNLSTCVVNGKIYAIGGIGDDFYTILSTVEEYDPETDTLGHEKLICRLRELTYPPA